MEAVLNSLTQLFALVTFTTQRIERGNVYKSREQGKRNMTCDRRVTVPLFLCMAPAKYSAT